MAAAGSVERGPSMVDQWGAYARSVSATASVIGWQLSAVRIPWSSVRGIGHDAVPQYSSQAYASFVRNLWFSGGHNWWFGAHTLIR